MEFEESVYNLIPKEQYVPPKAQKHKSRHDPKCAPTGSSFGLKNTSKPGVSNLSGDKEAPGGSHSHKAASAMFGLPKGAAKPDTSTFRLKGTGTMKLPQPTKYQRPGDKKVAVPLKDEKPIMGLVSDKNFIVSNAVENILAAPKMPSANQRDYLKKKNFGKVPKYL